MISTDYEYHVTDYEFAARGRELIIIIGPLNTSTYTK
jgi:hypothetical protein